MAKHGHRRLRPCYRRVLFRLRPMDGDSSFRQERRSGISEEGWPSRIASPMGAFREGQSKRCHRLEKAVFRLISQRASCSSRGSLLAPHTLCRSTSAAGVFELRTSIVMAVPTWMPSRFWAVEKAPGSGWPSGVLLPALYLSPFRLSLASGSFGVPY
jgi:hypothetical protein